jgi:hypothetical protein
MKSALLTALAAIAGFVAKSLWDIYWRRREQHETFIRQKRVDFLERQLSLFYWPLYLHLQKNNVIWEHLIHGRAVDDSIKRQVDEGLESFFLPNHEMIVKIIESNVYLAQPESEFEDLLLRFIRHVTIYRTIRVVGATFDPVAVGEPFPTELFPAVERRLKLLQQEYNRELGYLTAPGKVA